MHPGDASFGDVRDVWERAPGVFFAPNKSAAAVESLEPQITAWGLSLAHRLELWWLLFAKGIVFHFYIYKKNLKQCH